MGATETVNITTLGLRNRLHEDGGAWITATVTAYHYKMLRECREAEPHADWHLETRGTSTGWHRYEPPMTETCRVPMVTCVNGLHDSDCRGNAVDCRATAGR